MVNIFITPWPLKDTKCECREQIPLYSEDYVKSQT